MTNANVTGFRRGRSREAVARSPAHGRHAAAALLSAAALTAALAPAQAAPAEIVWEDRIEVASGNAFQGPWRMNESHFDYVDDPTVVVGDQGQAWVAWADQSRQNILLQAFGPEGIRMFDQPVDVSRSPQIFSWLPRMIVDPGEANTLFVVWQDIVFSGGSHGGEIFFARSADGGRSFAESLNLSNSTAGAGKGRLTRDNWHNGSLDVAMGPDGTLYVAWTEYEGPLRLSMSTDGGASFSRPLHVAGSDAEPARGPALAAGADGRLYLAWAVGEDEAADIRLATSTDRGRSFGGPRALFRGDGHADAPTLAVDNGGTIHLAYAESRTGPFRQYRVRYARSTDGGETFESAHEIPPPREGRFVSMSFPGLDVDAQGNPYLVWELFPDPNARPQGLGFVRSIDGGRTFGTPSVVPGSADPAFGSNGGRQGLLTRKLSFGEAGDVAIVNSTFNINASSHVWLFRGAAADG